MRSDDNYFAGLEIDQFERGGVLAIEVDSLVCAVFDHFAQANTVCISTEVSRFLISLNPKTKQTNSITNLLQTHLERWEAKQWLRIEENQRDAIIHHCKLYVICCNERRFVETKKRSSYEFLNRKRLMISDRATIRTRWSRGRIEHSPILWNQLVVFSSRFDHFILLVSHIHILIDWFRSFYRRLWESNDWLDSRTIVPSRAPPLVALHSSTRFVFYRKW